jgi:hypothetical protein
LTRDLPINKNPDVHLKIPIQKDKKEEKGKKIQDATCVNLKSISEERVWNMSNDDARQFKTVKREDEQNEKSKCLDVT